MSAGDMPEASMRGTVQRRPGPAEVKPARRSAKLARPHGARVQARSWSRRARRPGGDGLRLGGAGGGASGGAADVGEESSGGESGGNDPQLQVPSESCAAAPAVGQGRFAGQLA
jgi:hypothetical protein